MSNSSPQVVVIGPHDSAPHGSLVVRRHDARHFVIEESQTPLELLPNGAVAAQVAANDTITGEPARMQMASAAYRYLSQSGHWYEFAQHENQLIIRPQA